MATPDIDSFVKAAVFSTLTNVSRTRWGRGAHARVNACWGQARMRGVNACQPLPACACSAGRQACARMRLRADLPFARGPRD